MKGRFAHIIMTLLLLPVFWTYSNGVNLIQHSCLTCQTSHFALSDDADTCCEDDGACDLSETAATCCTLPEEEQPMQCSDDCCELESYFLSLEESIVLEKAKITLVETDLLQADSSEVLNISPEQNITSAFYYAHAPPPRRTGISFLIFTRQLKIDCVV